MKVREWNGRQKDEGSYRKAFEETTCIRDRFGIRVSLQKAVGGYIEVLYPWDDMAALVCNDSAKIEGFPLNRALWDDEGELYDIIAGTFLIVGISESIYSEP